MLELMESDIDDKVRVDQWKIAKGIKEPNNDTPEEDPAPGAEVKADPGTVSSGPADYHSSARSSNDQSSPDVIPNVEEPERGVKNRERDGDDDGPSRPAARSRKEKAAAKRKREDGDAAEERPKSAPMFECLSLNTLEVIDPGTIDKVRNNKPTFVATHGLAGRENRWEIQAVQHESGKYFVHIDQRGIQTNSVAVPTELSLNGYIHDMKEVINPRGATSMCSVMLVAIKRNVKRHLLSESLKRGMNMQHEMDHNQMFLCSVSTEVSSQADVDQAVESSNKCHEPEFDWSSIEAWDDVNDCRLDPKQVFKARMEEIGYFRKRRVYKKAPKQKCRDVTGKSPKV